MPGSLNNSRLDGLSGYLSFKRPCRAATTAAITLSGEQTVDGIALVEGDRVLVKDQTDLKTNGVYTVSTGSWTRSKDFNSYYDAVLGTLVPVNKGTVNDTTLWRLTTDQENVIFDTHDITFEAYAPATFTGGTVVTLRVTDSLVVGECPTAIQVSGSDGAVTPVAQFRGTTKVGASMALGRHSADAIGFNQIFVKGRGDCTTPTLVNTGDELGVTSYCAANNTDFETEVVRVVGSATGTVTAGSIPGKWEVQISDGSSLVDRIAATNDVTLTPLDAVIVRADTVGNSSKLQIESDTTLPDGSVVSFVDTGSGAEWGLQMGGSDLSKSQPAYENPNSLRFRYFATGLGPSSGHSTMVLWPDTSTSDNQPGNVSVLGSLGVNVSSNVWDESPYNLSHLRGVITIGGDNVSPSGTNPPTTGLSGHVHIWADDIIAQGTHLKIMSSQNEVTKLTSTLTDPALFPHSVTVVQSVNCKRVNATVSVQIDSVAATFKLINPSAATDEKRWDWRLHQLGKEFFSGTIYADSGDPGELYDWLTLTRSGTGAGVQVDDITLSCEGIFNVLGTTGLQVAGQSVLAVGTQATAPSSTFSIDDMEAFSTLAASNSSGTMKVTVDGQTRYIQLYSDPPGQAVNPSAGTLSAAGTQPTVTNV